MQRIVACPSGRGALTVTSGVTVAGEAAAFGPALAEASGTSLTWAAAEAVRKAAAGTLNVM
jgi:hypothetical protein